MKINKKIGLISLIGLISPMVMYAATAAPARVYVERAGAFGLRLLIDSPAPVNAYDVRVTYDKAIVEIDSVDTSASVVTVLPQPIRADKGEIVIRGGSTVAFSGAAGVLAEFSLKPVSQGVAVFTVEKAAAYQADGTGAPLALESGAPLSLRVTPATFTSYAQAQSDQAISYGDAKPPEIIIAKIEENPLNYGERLLVFQAKDAQSGVARYEARDKVWLAWSSWHEAVNPYPIDDGSWAVQLKAVDNSGNFTLATVYQFGNAIWKAGLVLILLGIALSYWLSTRRKKGTEV